MKSIEDMKSIYELAHQFATRQWGKPRRNTVSELRSDLAEFGDKIITLPLTSRLTAEEKERVRVLYKEELGMAQHFHAKAKASNDISCRQHYYGLREPYISRMKLLERIFGSDFFKEGE